jgi:hypothetical protein
MQTIALKIQNDNMAQGLLAFLKGLSEVDVDMSPTKAQPAVDPEFPGFNEQSWKNLAADLETIQGQIDRGEVYTLEETMTMARQELNTRQQYERFLL